MILATTTDRIISSDGRRRHGVISLFARWLIVLLLLAGMLNRGVAQSDSPSEYQVKAAFLYNFAKFVKWPDTSFASPDSPFVIGIFGNDPFQGDLDRIVAGKMINGHPVVTKIISSVGDLKSCNVIFVNAAYEKRVAEISQTLTGSNALTVTENMKHFADSGFMINFVVQDNRIAFQINNTAAKGAGLVISSKLLLLARPMGQ